jgi:hypothetical protein
VLVVVLVLVGSLSGWLAARSSGGVTGLCASAPAGLRERTFPKTPTTEATVVLTDFRFGSVDNFYGIGDAAGRNWPQNGITVAVSGLRRGEERHSGGRRNRQPGARKHSRLPRLVLLRRGITRLSQCSGMTPERGAGNGRLRDRYEASGERTSAATGHRSPGRRR